MDDDAIARAAQEAERIYVDAAAAEWAKFGVTNEKPYVDKVDEWYTLEHRPPRGITMPPGRWMSAFAALIRAAALEEAAKACDVKRAEFWREEKSASTTDILRYKGDEAAECAAAIRALKTSPPETK